MTEQEAMQILADMGLHEGGMDNWVFDNAWYGFANVVEAKVRADEREACCSIVYGLCESDNVAQRTVDAIRARGTT